MYHFGIERVLKGYSKGIPRVYQGYSNPIAAKQNKTFKHEIDI